LRVWIQPQESNQKPKEPKCPVSIHFKLFQFTSIPELPVPGRQLGRVGRVGRGREGGAVTAAAAAARAYVAVAAVGVGGEWGRGRLDRALRAAAAAAARGAGVVVAERGRGAGLVEVDEGREAGVDEGGPVVAAELVGELELRDFVRECVDDVGEVVGGVGAEVAGVESDARRCLVNAGGEGGQVECALRVVMGAGEPAAAEDFVEFRSD